MKKETCGRNAAGTEDRPTGRIQGPVSGVGVLPAAGAFLHAPLVRESERAAARP
jgi:hypothetical protein